MSTFDESKIRRGQPDNAGKFAAKHNSAPASGLTAAPAFPFSDEDVQEVWHGYCGAALWSSVDEETGDSLDENYSADDFEENTAAEMDQDVRSFLTDNAELLDRAQGEYGYTLDQAGHDFWLTRNRHGAGFWDRNLGEVGDQLTDAAHDYPEITLYPGDDGKIYSM